MSNRTRNTGRHENNRGLPDIHHEDQAAARGNIPNRKPSQDGYTTSGMDRAMQVHADKLHPTRTAKPRSREATSDGSLPRMRHQDTPRAGAVPRR